MKADRNDPDVATEPNGIEVDEYAKVLAHLHHFRPEDSVEVLARLGMTPERWEAADAAWLEVLLCRGGRSDGLNALRFTAAFARARRELRMKTPPLRKIGPLPEPAVPVEAPSNPWLSSPPIEQRREVPSCMLSPTPGSADRTIAAEDSRRRRAVSMETEELDVVMFRAPLPFRERSSGRDDALGGVEISRNVARRTMALPVCHRDEPSTPFQTAPGPEGASEPRSEPVVPPDGSNLTIEQYASLRAELRGSSAPAPILAKYGVEGEPAMKVLEARFAEEMQRDSSVLARFAQAFKGHEERLQSLARKA